MPTIRRYNAADHVARPSGPRRLRGPRTLRVRLVVTIVLLIAAVCVVIGVSTEIYLGDYLVRQLDSQLLQVHQSATGPDRQSGSIGLSCAAPTGSGDSGGPAAFGFAQPIGALAATVKNGQVVVSGIVSTSNAAGCVALPAGAGSTLMARPVLAAAAAVTALLAVALALSTAGVSRFTFVTVLPRATKYAVSAKPAKVATMPATSVP